MTEPDIVESQLCSTIERDGISLRVEIYRGEDSEWILEVVDEDGNSIVWTDQFATDQAAMDELMRTIKVEGIRSIVEDPESSGS